MKVPLLTTPKKAAEVFKELEIPNFSEKSIRRKIDEGTLKKNRHYRNVGNGDERPRLVINVGNILKDLGVVL